MMRSLSSGVAGLRTHQTKMDVIGNNISNVSTYGFKSSRATFSDVYYQNLNGASSGRTGVQGGKNPTQIGYGATLATVDVANTVAGGNQTDFSLDVYITGEGFLVSKDSSGNTLYTRLGKLDFDSAGNLIDGSGNIIQGFQLDENGNPKIPANGKAEAGDLSGIYCDPAILSKLKEINISANGAIVGVMAGDKILKANKVPDCIDKDSLAIDPESDFTGAVQLAVGAIPSVTDINTAIGGTDAVTSIDFGSIGFPASGTSISYKMSFDHSTQTFTMKVAGTGTSKDGTYTGTVKSDGTVSLKASGSSNTAFEMTVNKDKLPTATTTDVALGGMDELKYQVTTQDEGDNVRKLPATGPQKFEEGKLGGLDGITINVKAGGLASKDIPCVQTLATATNDESILYPIGNIALAKFPNPNGMLEAGSSYFAQSANSGDPVFVKPGLDSTGGLKSGYLEMSNVDLSKEFTDMITTQRGFQANSRIITVSDTMLEELVNLKR